MSTNDDARPEADRPAERSPQERAAGARRWRDTCARSLDDQEGAALAAWRARSHE